MYLITDKYPPFSGAPSTIAAQSGANKKSA
jgi:hypothetical protein